MKKAALLIAFGLMVLAQWWVPVEMILGSQRILEEGHPLKFRCAPVDPTDPFRGRYIVLDFEVARVEVKPEQDFGAAKEVYLVFSKDSLGFARVESVSANPPVGSPLFVKAPIAFIDTEGGRKFLNLDLPFTRFYLEETKAPIAESLYRQGVSDTLGNTYGLVYIRNGEARIGDVFIRDTSILKRLGAK